MLTRRQVLAAIPALVCLLPIPTVQAAPPWLTGLGDYRIVDASGRITPKAVADASGRVALKPANPPSFLLRGRPFYASGYAGAVYGPGVRRAPLQPTGYYAGAGRKPCGHVGPCRHGN